MEKTKRIRIIYFFLAGIAITYPFILQLVFGLLGIKDSKLFTFNMDPKDFTISWVSLWGVICTIVGIYQIHEKITLSKKQHDDLIRTQCRQLDTQIQNNYIKRYMECINMLNSDNETVRLNAIRYLYILAKECKSYIEPVCGILCDILCSDSNYSKKEQQNIIKYLFNKKVSIFHEVKKNINKCNIIDLSFNNACINNTNFNNTSIENCSFQGTIISNSNFIGAHIKSSLFRTTHIKHTSFKDTLISDNTKFDRKPMYKVDFQSATLNKVIFSSTCFNNCNFSNSKITESQFSMIKFENCILDFDQIAKTNLTFSQSNYIHDFREMLPNKFNKIYTEGNIVSIP